MLKKTLAFLFLGSLAYADTGYVPSFVRAAVVINGTTVTVTSGGGYSTVQDEGSDLTQRAKLNFTGAGVSCADNAGDTRTDCTITSGGGGSSALQVTRSGVEITSPTASINFYSGDFLGSSIGGTTSYMFLNPGTTNYIRNTSSLQSNTTFYTSSGTVNTFNIGTSIRWPDGTVQISSPSASGSTSLTNSQVAFGSASDAITSTTSFKWSNTPGTFGPQLQVVGNQRIESYKSTAFGNTSSTMTIRATNSDYADSGIILDSIGPSAFSIMVGTNSVIGEYSTLTIDDATNESTSCGYGAMGYFNYDATASGNQVCFGNGTVKATVDMVVNGQSVCLEDGTNCPAAGVGDITAVSGGFGLTGGAASGDVTLAVVSTAAFTDRHNTFSSSQTVTSSMTISGAGGLTVSYGVWASTIVLNGLTTYRIPWVGSGGLITDSAALKWYSTDSRLETGQLLATSSITVQGAGGIGVTYGVTAGSVTADTTLTIPQGAAPTTSAAGQIAFDTTDGAIIAFDGATEKVIAHSTHSFTVTVSSGSGWDNVTLPVWRAPDNMAITINKIMAESLAAGTTVVYQLDERAYGSINSAGTDVFSVAYSSANNTGVTTTSFSNAGIAANATLVLKTPSASASGGSPTAMTLTVYYTKDRE